MKIEQEQADAGRPVAERTAGLPERPPRPAVSGLDPGADKPGACVHRAIEISLLSGPQVELQVRHSPAGDAVEQVRALDDRLQSAVRFFDERHRLFDQSDFVQSPRDAGQADVQPRRHFLHRPICQPAANPFDHPRRRLAIDPFQAPRHSGRAPRNVESVRSKDTGVRGNEPIEPVRRSVGQDIIDGSSKAFPRRRAPRDAPGSGPLPRFARAPAKRRNRSVHAHSSFRVGMHQAPHDLRVFRRHSQIIPPRVEKPLDGPPIQGQDVIDQHHAGEHERPQAIAVVGAGRSPPAGQSSGRESRRCQRQTGRRACEADGFSPPGREALSRREAAVSIVDHPAVLVTPVRQDVGTVVPVQRIAKKLK